MTSVFLGILLALFCAYRFIAKSPILWDSAIVIAMASVYSSISIPWFVSKPLTFLGKHSFNIFLFHTFSHIYLCILLSQHHLLEQESCIHCTNLTGGMHHHFNTYRPNKEDTASRHNNSKNNKIKI